MSIMYTSMRQSLAVAGPVRGERQGEQEHGLLASNDEGTRLPRHLQRGAHAGEAWR